MNKKQINITLLNIGAKNKKIFKTALENSKDIKFILKFHNKQSKTFLKHLKTVSDLIIFEIENSGISRLNILKNIDFFDLPVIILSNNYDEKISEYAFSKGIQDYIISDEINSGLFKRTILNSIKRNQYEHIKDTRTINNFFIYAPIGLHVFGPDKKIIEINQVELDLIGYERDEIVGKKTWEDLIIPEEKKLFKKHWADINKLGTVSNIEYTLIHKQGHRLNVILNASARFDNNGKLINTWGGIIDITEKKHYDAKIKELAKYPDENPNPVIRVNRQGAVIYANKGSDIILNEWDCKTGDKLPEYILKEIKKIFHEGVAKEIEFRCSNQYCLLLLSPVKGTDYMNMYGTLITRRKKAELELLKYKNRLEEKVKKRTEELSALNKQLNREIKDHKKTYSALRDSEEIVKNISSSAPDAIVMIDHYDKIIFWNESAEIMFGYSKDEALNNNFYKIIVPERFYKNFKRGLQKFIKTGRGKVIWKNLETYALRKDGTEFPVEISVSSIKITGKWNSIGIIRDISERKKTEIELQRLATVIEQVNESIVITDLSGNIEYVNPYFEKSTGYKSSEAIGKNPRILKSGVQSPDVYKNMWETIKSGNIWNGMFINRKKNRALYNEEANIFPIKNKEGDIISYAAVKRDITDRLQKEEQIKNQNEFLNTIIESLTHPFYVIDVESYEIILANSAANMDLTKNNLKCYNLTQNRDTPCNGSEEKCPMISIKKNKKPVTTEHVNYDKAGNEVYVEVYAYPIFDSEGKLIQIIEYTQDITDRKMIEKNMVKLSSAVEQSLNIIIITDTETNIDYVNPKFTEITGYSSDEVIGKKVSILGKRTTEEKKEFWEKLTANEEWVGEFYNRKKNGKRYWEFASISAIKNSYGEIINYLKVSVDITKRKEAERELYKAKIEAENANRTKSEFLANMSHEIRTPMNSVIGFVELLKKTEPSKKQQRYLSIITESSNALLSIINDVLDVSKIESGKLEIDNINFSPIKEFEPVIDLFTVKADEKDIELIIFIDPTLPYSVVGDPMRIRQVLINLIGNAIKFTGNKGQIYIEIENIKSLNNFCLINFSVTDNGIGISKKMQEKIFESFAQADGSITRKYGGTGLGLSISLKLITMMGGKLNLSSKLNKGSRFYFELKLKINNVNNVLSAFIDKKPANNCTIYKPDKKSNFQLDVLCRYLKTFNYSVKFISTKNELNKINKTDIIFFDFSSLNENELNNILSICEDNIFKILIHEKQKESFPYLGNKTIELIMLPLNSTKIYNSIVTGHERKIISTIELDFTEKKFKDSNVLVVEDNKTNQELLSILLHDMGIDAEIAENGLDAVHKFKQNKYNLILMDVNMPVMDGKESTKEIIRIEKTEAREHTPIIALTADIMGGNREKLLEIGMDDYLSKPVQFKKLFVVFNKYLKNNRGIENIIIDNELSKKAKEIGIKTEILSNLIKKFFKNSGDIVKEINNAIIENDFKKVYSRSHKLKGVALNLRFKEIAAIAKKIEISSMGNNTECRGHMENLNEEFIKLKKYYNK